MIRGERVGLRAMKSLGADAQIIDEKSAQNRVKLFVFFSSHPCISPS